MALALGKYRFNGSTLATIEHPGEIALLVADSWLLDEGRVVALDAHFARFARSARAQGMVTDPSAFLETVRDALPTQGAWFPRIELTMRGELQLSLRPAPERTDTVTLWSSDTDPRTEPEIKGPDIPALEELRSLARVHGATEPMLFTPEGFIVDGATTCLLWWLNDELYLPPRNFARVASVTQGILESFAEQHGVVLREMAAQPDDLEGAEVWALNALHGIRPADGWVNGPELSTDRKRLVRWRDAYEEARQLVTN